MKLPLAFLSIFFIAGVGISAGFCLYFFYVSESFLEEEVGENLQSISLAHSQHVNTYLEEKMDRVFDFAHDAFILSHVKKVNNEGYSEELGSLISEHIVGHEILQRQEFYEVFVLDKNGLLIGTTKLDWEPESDLSSSLFFIEGREFAHVGNFVYDNQSRREGVTISSPMISEGEFLGVIVFRLSIDHLTSLVKNMRSFNEIGPLGVGQFGDIYLVNNEGFLITPSKFLKGDTKGILLQHAGSPNVENCFNMEHPGEHIGHESVISFVDFRGVEVIGTHNIIPLANWCLLVEADRDEAVNNPRNNILGNCVFFITSFIIAFSLLGYFIGKRFSLKRN
jgi:hypothetical protein